MKIRKRPKKKGHGFAICHYIFVAQCLGILVDAKKELGNNAQYMVGESIFRQY